MEQVNGDCYGELVQIRDGNEPLSKMRMVIHADGFSHPCIQF